MGKQKKNNKEKNWTISTWLSIIAIIVPILAAVYTTHVNINVRIAKLSERCENNINLIKNIDKKIVEYDINIKKCENEVSNILGQFKILKGLLLRNVNYDLNNKKND